MGLTNYPNGISSFGVPVLGGSADITTGSVFFVHSGTGSDAGNSYGKKPSKPFATIDYAIGRCTANKGDVIYVMPGHSETIVGAAGIACATAGIRIVGLGGLTNRPIVTLSTDTAAQMTVSAANVSISNIQFQNAIDSLVAGISVSAAACEIRGCSFTSPTATNDALIWVLTTAAADDLVIADCDFRGNNAGPTEAIRLVGADRAKIIGNYITGSYSTAAINGITTASLELLIGWNTITNSVTDKLLVDLVASCTGRICYNNGTVVSTGAITAANIIDAASCQLAENYVSDAVGETGKLIGTVSA